MKEILLISILLIIVVSSQFNEIYYDVFNLQAKGCENKTLNLYECDYYCHKYASITKEGYNYKVSFYSDYTCNNRMNTNYMYFNCNSNYNASSFDNRVYCSNLLPKYSAFQFIKAPCENDKFIPLGQRTSVCDSNIIVNYDPFEDYIITFYTNDFTEIIYNQTISFYCNNESESVIKGENDNYKLSCVENLNIYKIK